MKGLEKNGEFDHICTSFDIEMGDSTRSLDSSRSGRVSKSWTQYHNMHMQYAYAYHF